MPRAPCCEKTEVRKGPWSVHEDRILTNYIQNHGHANWRALPKQAGLLRCGKSCRLRWINYLRPDIKRGNFSLEEEEAIINLHQMLGNRWSAIAAKLPGRTDNEIKNVWHTHLKKRPSKKESGTKEEEEEEESESSGSIIDSSSDSSCSGTTNDDDKSDNHDMLESFPESFWFEALSEDEEKNNNSSNYYDGLMSLDDIEQLSLMMENNGSDDAMDFWYNVFLGKDNL